MELKQTSQHGSMKDFTNANIGSQRELKYLLDKILAFATEPLVNINDQNSGEYTYLSIGNSNAFSESSNVDITKKSLVLCRSYFSNTSSPIQDLEAIYTSLKSGGRIIIQEINFSEINCFPFNYALGRFKNLYSKVGILSGHNPHVRSSLSKMLKGEGFTQIERSYLSPIFLRSSHRELILNLFWNVSEKALANNLIVEEERIALAAEISNYLQEDRNMISLPGVFQIKGKK